MRHCKGCARTCELGFSATRRSGFRTRRFNCSANSPERSSSCPMMMTRGVAASLTVDRGEGTRDWCTRRSRQRSGAWYSVSSNGMTTSSVVPGGTVPRMMTTRYRPGSYDAARPRRLTHRSWLPQPRADEGLLVHSAVGVETDTSTTSTSERSMPFIWTALRPWARRSESTASLDVAERNPVSL